MSTAIQGSKPDPISPQFPAYSPTPWWWRAVIAGGILVLAALAYLLDPVIGARGRAALGLCCFIGLAFAVSANLRAVNWHTVVWGIVLQVLLALLVLQFEPGRQAFEAAGGVVKKFLAFSQKGSEFVFGVLSDPGSMGKVFGKDKGFVFAFVALPTIIFVSSFFSVLYYIGVLQLVVRFFAWLMRMVMRTSGAETLSVTANVFMGQTEAPLIIKPYIPRMTQSELLALMTGGMAHVSGSLLAVYMGLGADAVALLATSVMASPCTLYLAKIVLPETQSPLTTTGETTSDEAHANVIDAAAAGASDGMRLALNVAAMLIAFIAFIALGNALLGLIHPDLSLEIIFARVFSPLAYLLGVDVAETGYVGDLLGKKLVLNELVAYTDMKDYIDKGYLNDRSRILATYALTGFANFASIGIQIGGIGALAPSRRGDLARLGPRALFTGFLVTLVNAALAGVLLV